MALKQNTVPLSQEEHRRGWAGPPSPTASHLHVCSLFWYVFSDLQLSKLCYFVTITKKNG
jgi:hypothetical protein